MSFLFVLFLLLAAAQATSFSHVDSILAEGIEKKVFPGAVCLIGDKSGILYNKAFGRFTFDASSKPMELTTQFDLASVTKVLSTTTIVAWLYEHGFLHLGMCQKKYTK